VRNFSKTIESLLDSNLACLAFIFVCCFLIFGFPLLFGLPSGFDMLTDIRFATVFRDGILSGQFFPGWGNDNFGFGSVGVRFYPPVAFYGLAIAEMLTGNWFSALWISLLFWMFLGSSAVYLFVKEFSTSYQGLIAAIIYAVVPQHLNEIFQFFLFAEFAAWGVLPFCFWFLTRVCRGGSWYDAMLFSFAYSVLILTHIPTTIIASFCFPIYVLTLLDRQRILPVFKKLAASIAMTIAATSFRWINLVFEYDWLAHNSDKWATGYYQYSAWFFPNVLHERGQFIYVLTSTLFDISMVMTIGLTIPAIVYLYVRRNERTGTAWKMLAASVATASFAFFMLSQPSRFIWDGLPFLQKIQFPWRWLSVVSLLAVIAFALAVPKLLEIFRSRERLIAYPALALVFAIVLFDITQIIIPSDPIPSAKFSAVEKKLAEEPIFEGWWPVWARHESFQYNSGASADGRQVEVTSTSSLSRTLLVASGEGADLSVPIFFYPHWKASVNGNPVAVSFSENGVVSIPIAGEAALVKLYFEEPARNVLAIWLSLIAWLMISGVLLLKLVPLTVPKFLAKTIETTIRKQIVIPRSLRSNNLER
jgi:hypothetical protein